MHNQAIIDEVANAVVLAAKSNFGNKLDKVILYGSYACGEYKDDSDMDIMILADIPRESCWEEYLKISELTWELDIKFNILLSINVTDCETFYKYAEVLPYYSNVLNEGVSLVA